MSQFRYILLLILLTACMPEDKPAANTEKQKETTNFANYLSDSARFTSFEWHDTLIDFGTEKKGKQVEIKFTCINTGSKDLVLANVKPSCGCTLADYSKQPIAPGKSGFIKATFDTNKSHGGQVRKSISYEVNSNNKPRLIFTGTVLDPAAKKDSTNN